MKSCICTYQNSLICFSPCRDLYLKETCSLGISSFGSSYLRLELYANQTPHQARLLHTFLKQSMLYGAEKYHRWYIKEPHVILVPLREYNYVTVLMLELTKWQYKQKQMHKLLETQYMLFINVCVCKWGTGNSVQRQELLLNCGVGGVFCKAKT